MDKIVKVSRDTLARAAQIIREGGLVAFPTETVYGLGASAFLPQAVARIFEAKKRPRFDPLIVHIARWEEVGELCSVFPPQARLLAKQFWPGPLTLICPKKKEVPEIVTAGLSTVAVRMPSHPVALELITRAGVPIAAPSANRFGHVSPTRAEEVFSDLGEAVDLILDGGKTPVGVESTVLLVEEERVVLLRPGGIALEELEKVVGKIEIGGKEESPLSPGTLKKHYAPQVPLYLFKGKNEELKELTENGIVVLAPFPLDVSRLKVRVLSERGDLREVAAFLFSTLRELEKTSLRAIVALPVEEKGLGRAVMDRLRRAASGWAQIKAGKLILVDKEE